MLTRGSVAGPNKLALLSSIFQAKVVAIGFVVVIVVEVVAVVVVAIVELFVDDVEVVVESATLFCNLKKKEPLVEPLPWKAENDLASLDRWQQQ